MIKFRACKKFLAVAASVFFAFFIAEIAFRALISRDLVYYPKVDSDKILHRYSGIKGLVYEMKPSFRAEEEGIEYATNTYGMRDYEYTVNKPAGTIRVCVLGDSISFGWRLPVEQTFAKILEKRLNNQAANGAKFEVLNFSVTGYNSFQEEIALKRKVMAFHPDIVIVGFCLNDGTFTDGFAELKREMSPYAIGSRLHSKLLSYLLNKYEAGNFSRLAGKNKIRHFFEQAAHTGKTSGIRVVILVFPYYFDNIEAYDLTMHKYVRSVAEKEGLEVLDLLDYWKDMPAGQRKILYLPGDQAHLSGYGMEKTAKELFKYLASIYAPLFKNN